MEERQFDQLTKQLAQQVSRRNVFRTEVAAAAGDVRLPQWAVTLHPRSGLSAWLSQL